MTSPDLAPAATRRRAALVAGLATVAMAPLGIFGNLTVLGLAAPQPTGTAELVRDAGALVGAAVVAFLLVVVLDIVVAWALARYFARDGEGLAGLAAWFRVAYAAVLASAAGQLAQAVDPAASDTVIAAAVAGFGTTWQVGLVIFAAHLLLLGGLIVRERSTPTLFGVIILVAGAAYAADGIARLFAPADAIVLVALTGIVSVTSIVGELGFAIWLLVRGGRR